MRRLALVLALAALAFAACSRQAPTEYHLTPASLPDFFDCLRERGQTIVAAHRGGPAPGFAENSIETFAHTLSQAPALLEIDIAKTADGALVLMHDDTVDRTANGHGAVSDLTLAQIQTLSLRDNDGQALQAHPPTLQQALDWAAGKTILELDVKRGVAYEEVVAAVRAADAMGRVIFITYSDDAALRVHRLASEMMLSVTMDDAADIATLRRRGLDLTRVVAWTGIEESNAALNIALARAHVEAMFGTLGRPDTSWDGRFAREGAEQYSAFAETGLQVIASDRPQEAAHDLDAHDGVDGVGAMQCVAAQ